MTFNPIEQLEEIGSFWHDIFNLEELKEVNFNAFEKEYTNEFADMRKECHLPDITGKMLYNKIKKR